MKYEFEICEVGKSYRREFEITTLCGLGFTSRNIDIIKAHIDEQLKIGITTSSDIPHYFLCWPGLISFSNRLFVVGNDSTGELEFTIVKGNDEEVYIGLVSDHCDRQLSRVKVRKSKQVCCKPVSRQLWRYKDIKDHWDQIRLISWQYRGDEETLYQKGSLSDYITLEEIIEFAERSMGVTHNYLVMAGTINTISGYFENDGFKGKMIDPILGRELIID